MTAFPKPVLDYWHQTLSADRASVHGNLSYAVSDRLNPKRPAMMLEQADGSLRLVVTPEIAQRAGIAELDGLAMDDLKSRLGQAGVTLHDPDYLFYLSADVHVAADPAKAPRKLTDADRTAFEIFYNAASEQDREDAWVELDHWAVFGCFDGGRLVCAASMNLWDDSPIADLGVLTLSDARGKRFARATVQSINRFSRQQGYEPQYRCQIDNHASVALARSCGLTLFGRWTVATDPRGPSIT
ncbi:GNAT family N-acetyltransferase [Sphingomonas sp. CFBP 13714]|uniref:GNAT family N-acetyltransferase n=1 Tax=Sphingomonas sp. CFBP 13714 TaxID=2775308 RepID=UPI0018D5ABE6|nr:GNAT family N-acetyltransferase [Sphingomonas sp. CFBP 13714]